MVVDDPNVINVVDLTQRQRPIKADDASQLLQKRLLTRLSVEPFRLPEFLRHDTAVPRAICARNQQGVALERDGVDRHRLPPAGETGGVLLRYFLAKPRSDVTYLSRRQRQTNNAEGSKALAGMDKNRSVSCNRRQQHGTTTEQN